MSIKLGLLGVAHIHSRAYIEIVSSLPEVEFLGLSDDNAVRGKYLANATGCSYYTSHKDLLLQNPDALIIASENAYHRTLMEMAMGHCSAILCEKPLATTVQDAEAMIDIAHKNKVLLLPALPMRFSLPILQVKEELQQNKLGKIICFTASNQGQIPPSSHSWFTQEELSGGGALIDHSIHLLDIMRLYTSSEVCEVYAQVNRIIGSTNTQEEEAAQVETACMLMLQFRNGCFATIDASWSRPSTWPSWGGLSFDIITTEAVCSVDAFARNITLCQSQKVNMVHDENTPRGHDWSAPGSTWRWIDTAQDPTKDMIQYFITLVGEGQHRCERQLYLQAEDGLAAARVVEAAYKSCKENKVFVI